MSYTQWPVIRNLLIGLLLLSFPLKILASSDEFTGDDRTAFYTAGAMVAIRVHDPEILALLAVSALTIYVTAQELQFLSRNQESIQSNVNFIVSLFVAQLFQGKLKKGPAPVVPLKAGMESTPASPDPNSDDPKRKATQTKLRLYSIVKSKARAEQALKDFEDLLTQRESQAIRNSIDELKTRISELERGNEASIQRACDSAKRLDDVVRREVTRAIQIEKSEMIQSLKESSFYEEHPRLGDSEILRIRNTPVKRLPEMRRRVLEIIRGKRVPPISVTYN